MADNFIQGVLGNTYNSKGVNNESSTTSIPSSVGLDRNTVDYTLQPNDNPSSVSKKFNIPKQEVEDIAKVSNSTWNMGDVLKGLEPRGYPVTGVHKMPEFVKRQEGGGMEHVILRPHIPNDSSGLTLGYGYDKTGRNPKDIYKDFNEAGISNVKAKAFIEGRKNFSITSEQASRLSDIAWRSKYELGIRIGIPLDTMEPSSRDKVMSLLYRGDIKKDEVDDNGNSTYRAKLYNLARANKITNIDNLIINGKVPDILKTRWTKF